MGEPDRFTFFAVRRRPVEPGAAIDVLFRRLREHNVVDVTAAPIAVDCRGWTQWTLARWETSAVDVDFIVFPSGEWELLRLCLPPALLARHEGKAATRFLQDLSESWNVSHSRSHWGICAGDDAWPAVWDGRPRGIGWFQYFSPAWPTTWTPAAHRPPVGERIEWLPSGAVCIVVGPDPFAWQDPPLTVRVALVDALRLPVS